MITGDQLLLLLEHNGFYFHKEVLFNYYVSLKTKPFVILTGISGSGKSKIAEVFADIISEGDKENYELVPVKPNWRDNKGIFGYHNVIDDSYYITKVVKLFIRALANPDKPYFLILDEMNIAKVEHYFADYLSLIESRRFVDDENDELTIDDFNYNPNETLSKAIILSAIDINKPGEFLPISDYRENRFSQKWKNQIFGGNNWTAQYRSELNQGDGRLAHRVFESEPGGHNYRLKDKSLMNDDDRRVVEQLEELYNNSLTRRKRIVQDNIVLHNSNVCIGSASGKKCLCSTCPYKNNEKYKCEQLYDSSTESYLVPPELPIPLNVFTIGTVNVDETTYMFSPKVLDRSNVIEFNDVDIKRVYNLPDNLARFLAIYRGIYYEDYFFDTDIDLHSNLTIDLPQAGHVVKILNDYPEESKGLLAVFNVLEKYNMQFGYRVMNEIACYIVNVVALSGVNTNINKAIDIQILQKVLPKLHGSYDKLWNPLAELLVSCGNDGETWNRPITMTSLLEKLLSDNEDKAIESIEKSVFESIFKYPKAAEKILYMLNDLDKQGFATFIR